MTMLRTVLACGLITALLGTGQSYAQVQEAPPEQQTKLFSLQHAQAASVAQIIEQLYNNGEFRISIDNRTNTILVHGEPGELEMIEAVLMRLDRAAPERAVTVETANTPPASAAEVTRRAATLRDLQRTAFDRLRDLESQIAQAADASAAASNLPKEQREEELRRIKQREEELRRIIENAYDARQQLQQAQVEQLKLRLASVEQQLQLRQQMKEQIIEQRLQQLLTSPRQMIPPPDDRLLSLMLEEKELLQDYGPNHPKVRQVREQIEVTRRFLGHNMYPGGMLPAPVPGGAPATSSSLSATYDPAAVVAASAAPANPYAASSAGPIPIRSGIGSSATQPHELLRALDAAEAAAAAAAAKMASAQAQVEQHQNDLERLEGLREKGFVSASEVSAAGARLAAARASLREAEVAAKQAPRQLQMAKDQLAAQRRLLELDVAEAELRWQHAQSERQELEQFLKSNPGTVSPYKVGQKRLAEDEAALQLTRAKTLRELYDKIQPSEGPEEILEEETLEVEESATP